MRDWSGHRRIAAVFQGFKLSSSDIEGWVRKHHVQMTSLGSALDDARKLLNSSDPESHTGRHFNFQWRHLCLWGGWWKGISWSTEFAVEHLEKKKQVGILTHVLSKERKELDPECLKPSLGFFRLFCNLSFPSALDIFSWVQAFREFSENLRSYNKVRTWFRVFFSLFY